MSDVQLTLRYGEMDSPIGCLTLVADAAGLCCIEFGPYADSRDKLSAWMRRWYGDAVMKLDTPAISPYGTQLDEYFSGARTSFDIPLSFQGTSFQKQVWTALLDVPYGRTSSYKDIAIHIGNPMAVRAVGGANNKNPVPIVVPCHRVIGASGSMVGYGGGLHIKEMLLRMEAQGSA